MRISSPSVYFFIGTPTCSVPLIDFEFKTRTMQRESGATGLAGLQPKISGDWAPSWGLCMRRCCRQSVLPFAIKFLP